ncbi:WD40 repeat domain-containing protein [Fictibacillus sp. S7]|uniref:WD40 repeat domain-containing protein n=1 Tax=Fictibacillus sp. S7 TaxID=2212476 RepID=UPI00101387F2|nr:WD40 repeat domain-containing protein [Fictibacillus sp. S7]RXZ01386.1 hypothetical protein DMO16_18015 [Fictibacillus sp. S7]
MKKWYMNLLLCCLLATCLFPFSIQAHTAGHTERLGTAHFNIGIHSSAYGKGPDGNQVIYAAASGTPTMLNIINPVDGKKIASHPLNGAASAWGMVVDPNGLVYIAGGSFLYRYDPKTDTVTNLGKPVESETALWRLQSDHLGRIFGGTYPNGKVFMYDPEKKSFTDFGQVAQDQGYTRSVAVAQRHVYAGTGVKKAQLIEIMPETGKKNNIPLPEKFASEQDLYDLDAYRGFLFARVTPSNTMLVYDLTKKKWVDEFENVKGSRVSPPDAKGLVYFNIGDELYSYRLSDKELTPTGYKESWSNKGFGWMKLPGAGLKGKSLLSMRYNGSFWIYNPKTGQSKSIEADIEGQPVEIQSIGRGPDGNIYTSGYPTGGFTKYSPEDHEFTRFRGFGQAENMLSTDRFLYLGVYTGGVIYKYDPEKPYDHDPVNVPKATNPRALFSLKSESQDRPFGWAKGDRNLFIGTVPDYGKLGGALTVLNEETESYDVHPNIVSNQSIISLSYNGGIVYGGTSVFGGLGSTPTESEGKLFAYDPAANKKLFEISPLPGEKAIGALSFDKNGYLWGMSPGKIFKFDPATRQVIGSKELFPFSWSSIGHYWRGVFLDYDSDGNFYGTTLGKLFKFNPETWETEILDEDASLYAKDLSGNFYFSRGTDLYRYSR